MTRGKIIHDRVLALSPSTWGTGFAVFEGFPYLIDHGTRVAPPRRRNAGTVARIEKLIAWYAPDIIVLEEGRRSERIRDLIDEVSELAKCKRIRVITYSRESIRQCFAEGLKKDKAATKVDIVGAICKEYPELQLRRPPMREPWMSEDFRMSIFAAVALAITYYSLQSKKAA